MKNILILTPQIPYPPRQGASMRNYYIIKGLAQNNRVSLLTFKEDNQSTDPETIGPLLALCGQRVYTVNVPQRTTADRLRMMLISSYPDMGHRLHDDEFNQSLIKLITGELFDIIQIEGIELARTMPLIRQYSPESLIVFDNHNAETELQRRALQTDWRKPQRWAGAAYSAVQVVKLSRFEAWACETADAVTVVSAADADHLRMLVPNLKAIAIPNCIDIEMYEGVQPTADKQYDLVFTGKMDYRPNVDAMLWFADEIWPIIKTNRPQTTLAIVGQKPHARLDPISDYSDITVTGFVESVGPYLLGAGVVIMPLRMGSGTRLKFLEACAAQKAIVSTYVGAEGFPVVQGKHAFLADEPTWFAEYCLSLLNNAEGAQKLGRAAYEFAKEYDWRRVIPTFEQVYKTALKRDV